MRVLHPCFTMEAFPCTRFGPCAIRRSRPCNPMPDIAMKENIFYWIRVLILTGILLFILVSCTAWAHPVSSVPSDSASAQAEWPTQQEHACRFIVRQA